ncbi:methyl-accepting chemotaxis protein [Vibrio ostreae]|uniref:Methyl-accepting chemotaxis protein n=1 Tax=Vibrio ostreae TaxID=2841925 RepID=A0A975U6Z2_9VIBR|nr:methyl-accepting chemotaxis protein [Vibrio ostreae]QXO15431.1 methyl-accepting chemotaxis protein [Vibrio ostreae]
MLSTQQRLALATTLGAALTLAGGWRLGIESGGFIFLSAAIPLLLAPWQMRSQHTDGQTDSYASDDNALIAAQIGAELNKNAVSAAKVSYALDTVKQQTSRQVTSIERISDSSEAITDTLAVSASHTSSALQATQVMRATSEEGRAELDQAVQSMQQLSHQTDASVDQIKTLESQVERIETVVEVIESIAAQTNLLALNAAIEAARAGESGRGFAVVADEVRNLAERTARSTEEVSTIVGQIFAQTRQVTASIGELSTNVTQGVARVESVSQRLETIASQSQQVEQQMSAISDDVATNEQSLRQIARSITHSQQELSASDHELLELQTEAEHLMQLAEHSNAVLVEHYPQSMHRPFYELASTLATAVGKKFEQDIASGVISQQALFDRQYQPVGNTQPAKYQTAFDQYCDSVLPSMQEPVLTQRPEMVYAIATDDHGYVPTHNNQFCQPLTGNPQQDMVGNRTKRIFSDRVGMRCGQHQQTMLLQTYKRDTGEVMHDISVPVYVNGRHWGGMRLGYAPPQ